MRKKGAFISNQKTVAKKMQSLVQRWTEVSDRRAVFLHCYMLMTNNMLKALRAEEFHDPQWVNALLHRFADYYFEALDAYEVDSPNTPVVWRVAHDAAREKKSHILQHLMLGINAHINYDLVLTLVDMLDPMWENLSTQTRKVRYSDHCYVNEVIGRTIDTVQDDVIERLSPSLDLADKALGPIDEWLTSHLIEKWREDVWDNAVQWMETQDEGERKKQQNRVEAATLQRAETILFKYPFSKD